MRPGVSHVAITEHTCAFLYFVIEKLNTIESEDRNNKFYTSETHSYS